MSAFVERAARAGDREDSAQRGEPDPWTYDFGDGGRGEDDPVFVAERLAVYRAALLAALDPEDEDAIARVGMEIANEIDGNYSVEQAQRIIASLRALAEEQP